MTNAKRQARRRFKKQAIEIPFVCLRHIGPVLFIGLVTVPPAAQAANFHIQLASGSIDEAIVEALVAARTHRISSPDDEIVIDLPPRLNILAPIQLGKLDSGRADAPLIFEGAPGGTIISGGITPKTQSLTDDDKAMLAPLGPALAANVEKFSIEPEASVVTPAFAAHSSFSTRNPGRLMVFRDGKRLLPARWPETGYATNPILQPGSGAIFAIKAPLAAKGLTNEKDLWIAGYWGWSWWFEAQKIESASANTLILQKPEASLRPGARYYIYNLISGLLNGNVFYWNKTNKSFYALRPPTQNEDKIDIAATESILNIKDASYIQFNRIAFEKSIGATVTEEKSDHIAITNCYIGHSGTWGLVINGGNDDLVDHCIVEDTGYAGISISGGDEQTLAHSNHIIRDSRISQFGVSLPTYQPGISIAGVGATVWGCDISAGSHAGILFRGNDHRIKGNILHDLVLDSNDSGAIYAGRNWVSRGTEIKGNLIFNITNHVDPSFVEGVYLDDQISGTIVEANIFKNVDEPILVGGGRDNVIQSNLFLASKGHPIVLDSRGLTWQNDMVKAGGALYKSLNTVPYRGAIFSEHYPSLPSILEDAPGAPMHNKFLFNVADRSPVVFYDNPAIVKMGFEEGSLTLSNSSDDIDQAIASIHTSSLAKSELTETKKQIDRTQMTLHQLFFSTRPIP